MPNRMIAGTMLAFATSALIAADDAYADPNTCIWWTGSPGPDHYVIDVSDLYVPRDAAAGDIIGVLERPFRLPSAGTNILCENRPPNRLTFRASATAAPAPGVPRSNGMTIPGKVLQTNIPGVGVQIRFGSPYDGATSNFWRLAGADSIVPFDGFIDFDTSAFPPTHSLLRGTITLVKTGDIPLGRQTLDSGRALVKASFTGIPDAFSVALGGTLTQAHCSLTNNPVNPNPVNLGDWSTAKFTGEAATTDATPFTIALNACVSDPAGGTVTTAYIQLEPTNGSTIKYAREGVFTLETGSTAKGIGIQVLRADQATPLALADEERFDAIPVSGNMTLNLSARYYQIAPSKDVQPGTANGALDFTITYK
ncbi:fimbrial protein [Pseudomonas fontis]|uniref:Type 1 fimbrial protein n=1 Tax=Pseudomonas fontis TaxID=2942633 RepID=A0ABT5NU61_9PSED|nr:fimbrial protein [Pseudomonas fontis]MDD0977344.1 type 1 fimbrial protein [Pseudomonas fontis]MDD0991712.1 type 1 fimbrial protein [Pseudomonas fontis]